MTLSPDVIDGLPYVEGVLNYLTPMAERPINLAYDPPLGVPRSTGVPEAHRMTIYDVRPVAARLSLDSEGLALVTHNSAVRDFYDEDELQRVYYPEAERLVAEVTGATRVLVFDHTVRRRVWGGVDRSAGTPRQPVTVVHNDYTIDSGPQRVRDLMGDDGQTPPEKRCRRRDRRWLDRAVRDRAVRIAAAASARQLAHQDVDPGGFIDGDGAARAGTARTARGRKPRHNHAAGLQSWAARGVRDAGVLAADGRPLRLHLSRNVHRAAFARLHPRQGGRHVGFWPAGLGP